MRALCFSLFVECAIPSWACSHVRARVLMKLTAVCLRDLHVRLCHNISAPPPFRPVLYLLSVVAGEALMRFRAAQEHP